MSLESLPTEVLLHITSFVGQSGLNSLSQTWKSFTTRSLEQQLYYNDRKGARKALIWGINRGIVGTVIKAQQAGQDLDSSWLRRPFSSAPSAYSLHLSSVARPRCLIIKGNRTKKWLVSTALVHAIRNGHHAVVRYLIDQGVTLRGLTIYKTNYGNAWLDPIHHIILAAGEAKMQDLLLHILQQGVSSNSLGLLDENPCRLITSLGLSLQPKCPAEITEILLDHGADPAEPTGFWIWPDTVSCKPFEQVWQQLLVAEGWAWMAEVECAKKVCLLLKYVPNLNSVSVKDEPLLPLVCSHITPQRRELLSIIQSRRHGLDPNVRRPLNLLMSNMLQTDMGNKIPDPEKRMRYITSAEGMLQTLLSMGADPNAPPELPPLHKLCFSNDDGPHWDRVFETLVSYGARLGDTDKPGSWSRTPLHCVCLTSTPINLQRLKSLLELGSPVNALSSGGETTLSLLHRRNAIEPHPSLEVGLLILKRHGAVCTGCAKLRCSKRLFSALDKCVGT